MVALEAQRHVPGRVLADRRAPRRTSDSLQRCRVGAVWWRVAPRRKVSLELVRDEAHYRVVVAGAIASAKTSLWIGTANLKDVHVEAPVGSRARARGRYMSALELF